jgi:hypothetical protein
LPLPLDPVLLPPAPLPAWLAAPPGLLPLPLPSSGEKSAPPLPPQAATSAVSPTKPKMDFMS